jgi:hypothetical protein
MPFSLPLIHKVARRWARLSFEDRYARLLFSMSLDQAKVILGFPPGSSPTPIDVSKAYRAKAFENHPDRGGDSTKMVEINVARDILEGKGKPSRNPDPSPPKDPSSPPRRGPTDGQTFKKAWSSKSPPAGVVWKFISLPVSVWEDITLPGHQVWTLYGQTPSTHIFLAVKERFGPPGVGQKDWQVSWVASSRNQDISKIAPKYLKSVGTNWPDAKPSPPTKYLIWPGGLPTEQVIKKVRSGGVPLKEVLTWAGLVDPKKSSRPNQ